MKSFTNVEFANINVEDIIENPEKNSDEFLEIRNNLIKQCEDFVKKCDTEDFNIDNLPDVELYKEYTKRLKWYQQLNEDIRIKAKKNIYESEKRYIEYENMIKQNNEEWKHKYEELENQYSKLQGEFQQKNKELTSVYKSKGWKLLEKIRKLKIKKA
jgi:hypothetical protein